MRIEAIHVDGFGLMHGRTLEPSPNLTVIRGLNEAGKTTLLAFIRAILFGFETGRYRALAGGRRGGWLDVRTSDERAFRIERYGETGGQGRLRVLDADGRDLGAGELPILLQGVEQKLFRNIFAFGLDELARFEHLNDSEVAARIYGAGLGLGAVSALEVEGNLTGSAEALFKPGGQNPTINNLLRELEGIDDVLKNLNLPAAYGQAGDDLRQREARLAELTSEVVSAKQEVRRCERLCHAWEPWLELRTNLAKREELGDVVLLPHDLPSHLATLEARRDDGARKLSDLEARRIAQEEKLERISVDSDVLAHRADIEEIVREAERDRAREKELEGVAREIDDAERRRDDAIVRLGRDWTAERVAAFDDSVSVQSEINGRLRDLLDRSTVAVASARSAAEGIERDRGSAAAELAKLDAEIAEMLDSEKASPAISDQERLLAEIEVTVAARDRAQARREAASKEAADAATNLGGAPGQIGERVRAAQSLLDLLSEEGRTATLLTALAPGTAGVSGGWARMPLFVGAAALVIAVAASLAGAPLAFGAVVAVGGILGARGLWQLSMSAARQTPGDDIRGRLTAELEKMRLAAAASAEQLGLDRDAGFDAVTAFMQACAEEDMVRSRAASLQEAVDRAGLELTEIEAGLGRVAVTAGLSESPSEGELASLRGALASARDLRSRRIGLGEQAATLRRRIETFEHQAVDAHQRQAAAEDGERAAHDEWAAWLGAHDLDKSFDRETARTVIDAVTAAKQPLRSIAGLSDRRQKLQAQHDALLAQVKAAVASLGWATEPPGDRAALDRVVARLESALNEAQGAERDRLNARDVLDGLVRDESEARNASLVNADDLAGLMAAHGAPDVAALRTLIAASDAARSLDNEIAGCRTTLTALSGPGAALDALVAELETIGDISAVQSELDEAASRIEAREDEQAGLREEAGALREQIRKMESDVAATEKRQRKEDLLAQLQRRAEEWTVFALARQVLAHSRNDYEAAHRPAVIEAAERYFEAWTGGRYRRILAPLGRQVEEVEHRDGMRIALANLSTGTAQQLYLALRFGLVEHFAGTAEPLPIVMDDILVNFDDERAALAARSIEQLAERQQVIYFTCHPNTPLTTGKEIQLDPLETVAQSRGTPSRLA